MKAFEIYRFKFNGILNEIVSEMVVMHLPETDPRWDRMFNFPSVRDFSGEGPMLTLLTDIFVED